MGRYEAVGWGFGVLEHLYDTPCYVIYWRKLRRHSSGGVVGIQEYDLEAPKVFAHYKICSNYKMCSISLVQHS